MAQNNHEKEKNYVKHIYNSLLFLRAIKNSEGKDPSKFIVTDKDKHILEFSQK